MLNFLIIVSVIVWAMSSILFAAMFGAMFAPDKNKIISRSIISALLLIPCLLIVPLGFIAGIILFVIAFILGVTIFGVRVVIELIVDGIPEMDDDGNYVVKEETPKTPPWL